jgi:hypothetical protein
MPVLRAKGLEIGVPGVPGVPELPEVEMGFDVAEEVAGPVAPVLVALTWLEDRPLLPEVAAGLAVMVAAPPAPPTDEPVATLGPPVAVGLPVMAGAPVPMLAAAPPVPEFAAATPPVPPLPPLAAALVLLTAPPVGPDWALASEAAPEFELLDDRPVLADAPVGPLDATVVAVWAGVPVVWGMVAGTVVDGCGSVAGDVWATAAPPQNTRMAAMSAPSEADTLEIFREPGLPAFMLIPCRWGLRRPCRYSEALREGRWARPDYESRCSARGARSTRDR